MDYKEFEEMGLYKKKENALQRVRELYLSGKSILEIKDLIKSESLIAYLAITDIGLFILECFCLESGSLMLLMTLFTIRQDKDYERHVNFYNQRIITLIEENKSKWNV